MGINAGDYADHFIDPLRLIYLPKKEAVKKLGTEKLKCRYNVECVIGQVIFSSDPCR